MEIQKSSLGLAELVGDILDLSRLDLGVIEMNPVEFDLGTWLAEESVKLQPLAEGKHLGFECSPPVRPVRMWCDQIKLGRVITNLIGNAVKYTQQGDVKVCADVSDGWVRIAVRDTGIGIAPEYQGRIFDEYFQLKNPERDRNKGTGLGLSISRRLLDAMGGTLTVESARGRGARSRCRSRRG